MSARVAFLALISTTFATSIWASVAGRRTAITQDTSQRNRETVQCYNVFKRLGRSLTKNYLTTLITRGLKVISLINPLVRDVILFHLLSFLKINETFESFWRTVTKRGYVFKQGKSQHDFLHKRGFDYVLKMATTKQNDHEIWSMVLVI